MWPAHPPAPGTPQAQPGTNRTKDTTSMPKLRFPLPTMLCFTLLAVAGSASAQTTATSPLFLVTHDGKPDTQIIVGAAASPAEKYAARELQRAVKLISGAELPIRNGEARNTSSIIIGTPQSNAAIKAADLFNTGNPEEVRVVRRGGTLYLAGPTPRAALYATYTFLQETLGTRWFWPGADGEYFPQQKNIALATLDVRETPSIALRSLSINGKGNNRDETDIWMARNRANLTRIGPVGDQSQHIADLHEKGFEVLLSGHNVVLPHDLLVEHPEYAALYGGKRIIEGRPQLCWSNAVVQEKIADIVADWWDKYPQADTMALYPADNQGYCQCDVCQAMAPDVSTRWQKFTKIVIDRVNKTHPGKRYQTLAYQGYRPVPHGVVAPFEQEGYCTDDINYTKPITDATNAKTREEIAGWQKLGAKMGIRGYQFIAFQSNMYEPIAPLVMEEIAWASQQGLVGWSSEINTPKDASKTAPQDENWATNRLALYAAMQAMWNAKTSPDALVQDWSGHVFGPAAAPMHDYTKLMQQTWRAVPQQLDFVKRPEVKFAGAFITPELLQKAEADFRQARLSLAAMPDEVAKKRIASQIDLEAAMLDNWRTAFRLQQGTTQQYQAYAPRALVKPQLTAAADDPAWKNASPLPEFVGANGQPNAEKTRAYLLWDKDALYVRFVNRGGSPLKALASGHDQDLSADDAVELFLDDASTSGFFQLAANARGVRSDARFDNVLKMDKSWNPAWTAKASSDAQSWILDVALPFASFGIKPAEGATWKMSFGRSGKGWPEAPHNPSDFGTMTLVEKVPQPKRVLFYDADSESDSLRAELTKIGFTATPVAGNEKALAAALDRGADAVILRQNSNGKLDLSAAFISGRLRSFMEQGGLVIFAAGGELPLDKWFGGVAAVQWRDQGKNSHRVTTAQNSGAWNRAPYPLEPIIAKGMTPTAGYKPLSKDWESLAQLRLQNDEQVSFLMRLKVGRGALILTSSGLGNNGGYEMFGNFHPDAAAELVDNLLSAQRPANPG